MGSAQADGNEREGGRMSMEATMVLATRKLDELLERLENERQQIQELRSLLFFSSKEERECLTHF